MRISEVSGNIMATIPKILLLLIFIPPLGCKEQVGDSTPLIPKNLTNKNENNNTLLVFVGEKISVIELPYEKGSMDGGFKAKFKILQRVYGYYPNETIEYFAYDHYGTHAFSKFKNVLLYVSEDDGKFYHEKYMYDPLFKTKNGRWAGPYSDDYGHSYNENTTVKPEKIDFAEEVSLPRKVMNGDGKEYTITYPEPYYKNVGDKAIAVYGNYVKELFKLKKDGVLTARELFGDKKPEVHEIELEDSDDTTSKE